VQENAVCHAGTPIWRAIPARGAALHTACHPPPRPQQGSRPHVIDRRNQTRPPAAHTAAATTDAPVAQADAPRRPSDRDAPEQARSHAACGQSEAPGGSPGAVIRDLAQAGRPPGPHMPDTPLVPMRTAHRRRARAGHRWADASRGGCAGRKSSAGKSRLHCGRAVHEKGIQSPPLRPVFMQQGDPERTPRRTPSPSRPGCAPH